MKDLTPMEAPIEQTIAGMGELIDSVAAYTDSPDGLGYSYYYYTSEMWGNERVKLLEVNGVEPNPQTISSGEYPLKTAYYAVIRGDEPADSPVRKMISYLLSEEGQAMVEEAGYVRVKEKP
jgi:phosphate transport system substrate-binding protein